MALPPIKTPRTDDIHEMQKWQEAMSRAGTNVQGVLFPDDPDFQLQIDGKQANATSIKFTADGTTVRGAISGGQTAMMMQNAAYVDNTANSAYAGVWQDGQIMLWSNLVNVGQNVGDQACLQFRDATHDPSNPPSGMGLMYFRTDGSTYWRIYFKYNHGGSVKTGYLSLT